jgi:hypothetical protein
MSTKVGFSLKGRTYFGVADMVRYESRFDHAGFDIETPYTLQSHGHTTIVNEGYTLYGQTRGCSASTTLLD